MTKMSSPPSIRSTIAFAVYTHVFSGQIKCNHFQVTEFEYNSTTWDVAHFIHEIFFEKLLKISRILTKFANKLCFW